MTIFTDALVPHEVFTRRLADLCPLSPAALAAARTLISRTRDVRTRGEIISVNGAVPGARVLLSGFACRYRDDMDGRRQITGFVLPGELCDFGFLSATPAVQAVTATAPCTLGEIASADLAGVTEQYPDVMVALLRAAAVDQNVSRELVASLGSRSAVQRIGHLLCELHFRLGVVGGLRAENEFELPLTQSELGEALGLSTVHVNRTLQVLRRERLVETRGRLVLLPDPEALAKFCGFDPAYLRPASRAGATEQRSAQG